MNFLEIIGLIVVLFACILAALWGAGIIEVNLEKVEQGED